MPAKRKRNPKVASDPELSDDGGARTTEDPEANDNTSDCPYLVHFHRPARGIKKSRRSKGGAVAAKKAGDNQGGPPPKQDLDKAPIEDNESVYTITPRKKWSSLKKYRQFVVGNETFGVNDYVFINHQNIPAGQEVSAKDDRQFWIGRVLEIRAEDEAHVYIRLYYFYWPEELPGGRQYFHGERELVNSNHMEIVDAMTVSGRAEVKHWLELDEDEDVGALLFWRQKFDYPTQVLTEIREHCRCHRYYNPDKLMVGCPHCKIWLHEECIIDEIRRKIVECGSPEVNAAERKAEDKLTQVKATTTNVIDGEEIVPIPAAKTPVRRKGGKGRSLIQSAVDVFIAASKDAQPEPVVPGKSLSKAQLKGAMGKIEVTYLEGQVTAHIRDFRAEAVKPVEWEETVYCLVCNKVID